eukprot:scaffold23395_cov33-Tisochrysis_lutea.AAC.1
MEPSEQQSLLRRPFVHVDDVSEEEGAPVPSLEGLGDDMVVRREVRAADGAAVHHVRLDVPQEEPAHLRCGRSGWGGGPAGQEEARKEGRE